MSKTVAFKDLHKVNYKEAWDYQELLFDKSVKEKIEAKNKGEDAKTEHHLIFCEHNPVFTIGKSGDESHLLINTDSLKKEGIEYYKINRGGDITYHGLGQIVGYPILDLDCFFTDIHQYIRFLEQIIINTLNDFNINAERYTGYTGVWLDVDSAHLARKICAIGVRCSRWVTMHGFALNVNTDLSYFNKIIPCGITGKAVTSMKKELGKNIPLSLVKERIKHHFCNIFKVTLV